jgi:hypothetical protein
MGRIGIEPMKAQGQQIYSLPRLTASVPARKSPATAGDKFFMEPTSGIEPETSSFDAPLFYFAYQRTRLYIKLPQC